MSEGRQVDRGGVQADYARLRAQVDAGLQRIATFLRLAAARGVLQQEAALGLAVEDAIALQLGRLGGLVLELAHLWVLQERLGMPRKETESLDLLARAGKLPIDRARRLRMLAEYRLVVHRDLSRQDRTAWSGGAPSFELQDELRLFAEWAEEVAQGLGLRLP